MQKLFFFIFLNMFLFSCSNGQNKPSSPNLSAKEFNEFVTAMSDVQLVDVRTPGEYKKGHLDGAFNIDINNPEFQSQVATLDKAKPVFVYCLSGARSRAAAKYLRNSGYSEVYEMTKGLLEWRANGLPEIRSNAGSSPGMTMAQYQELLNSDVPVLVNFYAEWCAPCKKMKPYIDKISQNETSKVKLIRLDADENQMLCQSLGVTALPVIKMYEKGQLVWDHNGFASEELIMEKINK